MSLSRSVRPQRPVEHRWERLGVSMEVSNWRVYENCIIMEATVINISYNWRVTVSNCKVSNWCTSYTLQLLYENIQWLICYFTIDFDLESFSTIYIEVSNDR